jgi:hypothetical protein
MGSQKMNLRKILLYGSTKNEMKKPFHMGPLKMKLKETFLYGPHSNETEFLNIYNTYQKHYVMLLKININTKCTRVC